MKKILSRLKLNLYKFKKTKLSGQGVWKIEIRRLFPFLFPDGVTIKLHNGLKIFYSHDPVEEKIITGLQVWHKDLYFPEHLNLSKSNPLILDLGAHHGFYGLFALHHYSGARVIAVEPSAEGVRLISRNFTINKMADRVRIIKGAMAEHDAKGFLKISARGSWGNSLFDDEDVSGTEEVALYSLKTILNGEIPDIIKCNAEGAEFFLPSQLSLLNIRPEFMVVMVHKEFGYIERLVREFELLGYASQSTGTEKRPALHLYKRP